MLAMRKVALKILPLLVVLWATLAILGGSAELANKAADGGSAAKAGIGLCAVTVALLLSSGVKRASLPLLTRMPLLDAPRRQFSRTPAYPKPPPPGIPILKLLRVLRT